ncbi:hypothetical protein D9M71_287270 [compost metagenome]
MVVTRLGLQAAVVEQTVQRFLRRVAALEGWCGFALGDVAGEDDLHRRLPGQGIEGSIQATAGQVELDFRLGMGRQGQ